MSDRFRFKLKDKPSGEDGQEENEPKSKYFKPGSVFGSSSINNADKKVEATGSKANDDSFFEDDPELNDILLEASELYSQQAASAVSTSSGVVPQQSNKSPSKSFIPSLKNTNSILVHSSQRQNPLLKSLRAVQYTINDAISPAHYLISDSCCALFLSLKYHVIHPNYIIERITELKRNYQQKLLLLLIDHLVYEQILKELTMVATRTDFTLLVAWTYDDAAQHIANYRLNFDKPPDLIRGPVHVPTTSKATGSDKTVASVVDLNHQSLVDALTNVKAVNRTDAVTLLSTFDTFENIVNAGVNNLTLCPGISMKKAHRLHQLFNKPFVKGKESELN